MVERMEEKEGFLGRWSRLKRETRPEEAAGERPEALPAEIAKVEMVGEEAPELPSLDNLGSGSDYTGFLRREVPAELRREALRKAWTSDPVIAGFRGFAEYDWDFNAPGYGALRPTDDIARLLDAVLPDEKREEEVADAENSAESSQASTAVGLKDLPVDGENQLRSSVSPPLPTRYEASSNQATVPSPPRGEG